MIDFLKLLISDIAIIIYESIAILIIGFFTYKQYRINQSIRKNLEKIHAKQQQTAIDKLLMNEKKEAL